MKARSEPASRQGREEQPVESAGPPSASDPVTQSRSVSKSSQSACPSRIRPSRLRQRRRRTFLKHVRRCREQHRKVRPVPPPGAPGRSPDRRADAGGADGSASSARAEPHSWTNARRVRGIVGAIAAPLPSAELDLRRRSGALSFASKASRRSALPPRASLPRPSSDIRFGPMADLLRVAGMVGRLRRGIAAKARPPSTSGSLRGSPPVPCAPILSAPRPIRRRSSAKHS